MDFPLCRFCLWGIKMAKTAAERMRDCRERRKKGIVCIFKHESTTERARARRMRGGEELKLLEAVALKKYKKQIKREVFSHYGSGLCVCVQCGESRIDCLSIDHIQGNGNKHRRTIKRQGHNLYVWLRLEKYPEGYQTFCMNCQWVKRFANKEYNHLKYIVASVASVATVA